jgi:glycerophosphoryl diester phosphodiesterase
VHARDFAYLDWPGPVAMAHRGGALHPDNLGRENTLAAFASAVRLGYSYIETDVRATRDGVVVVFHDAELDRVTDRSGRIADLTLAEIRQARVGGTEVVPTLSEVLEEFPDVRINIDVKAPEAIDPLASVLRRHRALDRVCVGSFSERRLRAVRHRLGPGLATAAGPVGVAGERFLPGALPVWLRASAPVFQVPEAISLGERTVHLVTPRLVEQVHRAGKHLHVWTVDQPARMHRLLDLGVDGLVTDRTDVLREVLAERGTPLVP